MTKPIHTPQSRDIGRGPIIHQSSSVGTGFAHGMHIMDVWSDRTVPFSVDTDGAIHVEAVEIRLRDAAEFAESVIRTLSETFPEVETRSFSKHMVIHPGNHCARATHPGLQEGKVGLRVCVDADEALGHRLVGFYARELQSRLPAILTRVQDAVAGGQSSLCFGDDRPKPSAAVSPADGTPARELAQDCGHHQAADPQVALVLKAHDTLVQQLGARLNGKRYDVTVATKEGRAMACQGKFRAAQRQSAPAKKGRVVGYIKSLDKSPAEFTVVGKSSLDGTRERWRITYVYSQKLVRELSSLFALPSSEPVEFDVAYFVEHSLREVSSRVELIDCRAPKSDRSPPANESLGHVAASPGSERRAA